MRADAEGNVLAIENDEGACPACRAYELTRPLLPKIFRWVDYRHLKPANQDEVHVPTAVQQSNINQIRDGDLDGHSVLLLGLSRRGKTVLASALLQRMAECYIAEGFFDVRSREDYRLPSYRINADEWITKYEEHHAWNFDSYAPPSTA